MRRLTFRNSRGESVALGTSTPYPITKLEGTGATGVNIQTQKAPYQDGTTFIDSLLEPRYLSVEGAIRSRIQEDVFTHRRRMMSVLNPKLGLGILRYEYDGGDKEIFAIAESTPIFPDRETNPFQRFMISFFCPDPAWRDPQQEQLRLASFVGGFSFPFLFPISFGEIGQLVQIENKGDLDSPVLITMAGPLKNPVLENLTTGKKISLTQEIPTGESLEINTGFGQKTVTRVNGSTRSNAFHWISPDSDFWQLIPGINEVSYAATEEAGAASVTLGYYNRYLGV